jgi:hypothetical protein
MASFSGTRLVWLRQNRLIPSLFDPKLNLYGPRGSLEPQRGQYAALNETGRLQSWQFIVCIPGIFLSSKLDHPTLQDCNWVAKLTNIS